MTLQKKNILLCRHDLEDLSNEILIHIFEYLASPNAIYHSFKDLNHRFECLLHSCRVNLDIFTEDQPTLTLVHYFSASCDRLRVNNVCPLISLENFSHLRSLTIIEPTDTQINSIEARVLPMLEYLASPASMSIFDSLFGNETVQQWSYLRSCNFYFSHFPSSKLTWRVNRTLRRLLGIQCSRINLSHLLALLPCLEYLRVDMMVDDASDWNSVIFEKTLRTLRIGFHRLNFDDLRVLIGSNLRRLYLDIHDERSPMDYTSLGCLLTSLAGNLKQFNCDYRGIEMPLDQIRSAHRLFQNMQFIESHSNDIIRLQCRNMNFSFFDLEN